MNLNPMTRRELLTGTAAFLAASGCSSAIVGYSPTSSTPAHCARDDIDSLVKTHMRDLGIPGLSLAVVKHGELLFARSYGLNDVELVLPATNDTVYQLASVSKIFTSVGVMLLVDAGVLTLDTPVSTLWGKSPASWSDIRIAHLLSHTSGLAGSITANPRYAAEEVLRRNQERFSDAEKLDHFTAAERVEYLAELPLRSAPGAKWAYNQPGYILLGAIIERLSGQSFASFMRSRVFDPLGMRSAHYGDSRVVIQGRRQVAYTRQYGPFQNWLWPYASSDYPAAGLNMNAADAAKLLSAVDRDLLRPATRDLMWQEVVTADGKRSGYAMGWAVRDVRGRKVVGHEGGGCAWISHVPSEQLTAVVLSNLAGSGADLGDKTLSVLLAD